MKRTRPPVALTIAGSDSGGGAGIQADLKTFAALGVHGTCAITCLTAQNPRCVLGIQAAQPKIVRQQIEAVFAELPPAAVKTGMLFTAPIIRIVADFFRRRPRLPLIVDPVMVAGSGASLLEPAALRSLSEDLLPLATLVTPNLPEAEMLVGHKIADVDALRSAARELHSRFGCAALVKGGHLRGLSQAIDFFYDGSQELLLESRLIRGLVTHGTGCTYAAAIAGYCALNYELPEAVGRAKEFITQAIAHHWRVSGHVVLNSLWNRTGARTM